MRCACEPHWHFGRVRCGKRCPDDEGKKWTYHHHRERIYLGPESGEIIVHLHRNRQAGLRENLDVVLKIRRNKCVVKDRCGNIVEDVPETELRPFASDKSAYHFPIEGEFFTNSEKFPKGFYIGRVFIDGCEVDTVEIVKSPGVWVGEAIATTGKCFDTGVFKDDYCPVEDCTEERVPKKKHRKPCEPEIVVARKINNPMYVSDLSDLFRGE